MSRNAFASRVRNVHRSHPKTFSARIWWLAFALITASVAASSSFLMGAIRSAKAQPSAPLFGFNYPAGAPGAASADAVGQELGAIHPGSVDRLDINWAGMQPKCSLDQRPTAGVCLGGPGPIDWSSLDAAVASLHQHGVQILGLLLGSPAFAWNVSDCAGSHYYSCTSNAAGVSMPPADNNLGMSYLTNFVHAVVARYASLYPGEFVGFEVWNEENVYGFWPTTSGPDAARYTRLLCAAYKGIRSADSSVPVIYGGLAHVSAGSDSSGASAPVGFGSTTTFASSIPNFLNGSYLEGARSCMTAMAFHAYPSGSPDNASDSFMAAHSEVVTAEASNGDSGRPNWVTEFGFCTGNVGGRNACTAFTQLAQANFSECGYQLAVGMPDIKAFILHTLNDGPTASYLQDTALYGVFNYPGSPKPAATMLTHLFGATGGNVPAITNCSQEFSWQY